MGRWARWASSDDRPWAPVGKIINRGRYRCLYLQNLRVWEQVYPSGRLHRLCSVVVARHTRRKPVNLKCCSHGLEQVLSSINTCDPFSGLYKQPSAAQSYKQGLHSDAGAKQYISLVFDPGVVQVRAADRYAVKACHIYFMLSILNKLRYMCAFVSAVYIRVVALHVPW